MSDGPRPIDAIRKHYADSRRSIEVPEWGLTFWLYPVSYDELKSIRKKLEGDFSQHEFNAHLLILKARQADGRPAFLTGDYHWLMHEADGTLLQRVVDFAYTVGVAAEIASRDDAAKKSEPTPQTEGISAPD